MTTAIHKNLTGSDLHEPKGADTAVNGCVYVSDGAGSGAWTLASSVVTNQAFSTGDTKMTYKVVADTGWVMMDNGTIGDGSSGASNRANADTSALFTLLWNNTSLTVSTGRGASASADFAAHKTIQLPQISGSFPKIGSSGLATTGGASTVTLSTANLPPYTPSGTVTTVCIQSGNATAQFPDQGGPTKFAVGGTSSGGSLAQPMGFSSTFAGNAQGGTSTAFSIIPPYGIIYMMIKL